MTCLQCKSSTTNPMFCSRSCAATFNNKKFPKRSKRLILCDCGEPKTRNAQSCRLCFRVRKLNQYGLRTKGSFSSTFARHRYQRIRQHAHTLVELLDTAKICKVCAYDKHVQLCHLKSIGSFEDSVKIAEINSVSNLVYLCPNHHWELGNGVLTL